MKEEIIVEGIETNNLKNIDIKLKKNKINLIIGPSGSGKSSLAYDTIAQIGQHEFFAMFADDISEPTYKIKAFRNMIVAVPIKQSNFNNNLRSTIGTYFGMNRHIGTIYAALLEMSEDVFVINKESNFCEYCHGLGTISLLDENKIINYNIPIEKNPFRCWNKHKDFYLQILKQYCSDCKIDSKKTFKDLSNAEKNKLLFGESEKKYSISYKKTNSFSRRTTKFYGVMTGKTMIVNYSVSEKFYSERTCSHCNGKKYSKQHENYKLFNLSIGDLMITPFSEIFKILKEIKRELNNNKLSFPLNLIVSFVEKSIELNLGHLFFHRAIPTLSGGELQRLRMVQVFNTQLSDLLIVLDEPLAGLSGKEKDNLYENVIKLSDNHTVLVVDHSEKFVKDSAQIIALGEKGGNDGGFLIDINRYLEEQCKQEELFVPKIKNQINILIESNIYRYEGAKVCIAEGCMNLITGYSGVGKSTLLREYFPQFFEKYVYINQKPLLGNKNSSVATALNISSKISEMFAKKFSKDKRFFSNLTGNAGMCPVCKGAGYIEYGSDKNILRLECKECEGTGFNKDLKKYKIEGKSIFYVWKMTISEALSCNNFFDEEIINILRNASYIMIDHLRIGQLTSTLSGGENIRIKILKSSKNTSNVLGIDEPFKGLSKTEIYRMVKYLDSIRDSGKTIIVIDHTDNVDRFFSKKIVLSNKDNKLIGN